VLHVSETLHVYTDKSEAMKILKTYKRARFKPFKKREDAVEFAVHGSEILVVTSELSENLEATNPAVGEKPSPFKGPKAQDLVQLRKVIERGDICTFKITVWENPRYLVSSGDTPAILQVCSFLSFVISFEMYELTLSGILKIATCHLLLLVSCVAYSLAFQNIGLSLNYTVLQPRRLYFSQSWLKLLIFSVIFLLMVGCWALFWDFIY
jgi:hypothetical protein